MGAVDAAVHDGSLLGEAFGKRIEIASTRRLSATGEKYD